MRELAVGDHVFDDRGKPSLVTGVHPQPVDRTCFEVAFSDGATIVADAEHRWSTVDLAARRTAAYLTRSRGRPLDELGGQSRHRGVYRTSGGRWCAQVNLKGIYHGLGTYDLEEDAGHAAEQFRRRYMRPRGVEATRPQIRTTAQIRATLTVRGESNHAIPLCAALEYPHRDLPIDPYVLGVWLGDGDSAGARITSVDPEIREYVQRVGYTTSDHQHTDRAPTFGILGLHRQLRMAGLLSNKHVPVAYLTASIPQRLALVQGLMDTAGTCDTRQGTVEFCSIRRGLADAVHELLNSLGVKATIRTGQACLYGRIIGPSYRVCATTDLPVFRLPRKLVRLKPQPERSARDMRYIIDVRPVPTVPVRCISVDSPSHLYLAGRTMIPTHNTTTVANLGPELARLGRRVLMVGCDPQGDLEATFGIADEDPDIVRVEQLLAGGIDPRTAAIPITVPDCTGSLRLLASSSDLTAATTALARRDFQDLDRILDSFADDADIALIDTQGAFSPLSHTAARAADTVLFVMEPGYYEYRALAARLTDLEALKREEGWAITPLGVLFVRTDSRSRHMREYREHFADPDAFGGEPLHVLDAHVRQQASVRDHPRLGQPTVLAEPTSHVAVDYRAAATELTNRIASHHTVPRGTPTTGRPA